MNGSLMMQDVREAVYRGTPMASVSLPDLLAYAIPLAIVTFLWLQ
jgi:hypothetical protein